MSAVRTSLSTNPRVVIEPEVSRGGRSHPGDEARNRCLCRGDATITQPVEPSVAMNSSMSSAGAEP